MLSHYKICGTEELLYSTKIVLKINHSELGNITTVYHLK